MDYTTVITYFGGTFSSASNILSQNASILKFAPMIWIITPKSTLLYVVVAFIVSFALASHKSTTPIDLGLPALYLFRNP